VLLPPRTHVRVKETWGEKMSEAEAQGIQQAEGIGYSEGEQVADQQETPQDGQAPREEYMEMGSVEQTATGSEGSAGDPGMQGVYCDPNNPAGPVVQEDASQGMGGVAPACEEGQEAVPGEGVYQGTEATAQTDAEKTPEETAYEEEW
jgi:hypothetical protein